MKKVYYAHSMHLYNTVQEKRDVEFLEKLGYEVYNPNSQKVQEGVKEYKEKHGDSRTMEYFIDLIEACDILAFRSHIDGKIPSGVGAEINTALGFMMPIIELPTLVKSRLLDVEETRQYLTYNGQR